MTQVITSRSECSEITKIIAPEIFQTKPRRSHFASRTYTQDDFLIIALTGPGPAKQSKESKTLSSLNSLRKEFSSIDPLFEERLKNARSKLAEKLPNTNDLKKIRMKLGLSQSDLAERLGTSQSHIARIEKNPKAMMFETAIKLSEALGVDISEIARLSGLLQETEE